MNDARTLSATILLVEDSPEILDLLDLTLKKKGYTVLSSTSVESAIAAWEMQAGNVDLLITDVRLGQSGSGLDLVERLIALNQTLKVLVISGDSSIKELPALRSQIDLLCKPFLLKEVLRRVEGLLAAPANEDRFLCD